MSICNLKHPHHMDSNLLCLTGFIRVNSSKKYVDKSISRRIEVPNPCMFVARMKSLKSLLVSY